MRALFSAAAAALALIAAAPAFAQTSPDFYLISVSNRGDGTAFLSVIDSAATPAPQNGLVTATTLIYLRRTSGENARMDQVDEFNCGTRQVRTVSQSLSIAGGVPEPLPVQNTAWEAAEPDTPMMSALMFVCAAPAERVSNEAYLSLSQYNVPMDDAATIILTNVLNGRIGEGQDSESGGE